MAFATNDPRGPTEDYVTRLWGIGVKASVRDVVTVGGAIQHLLAETRSGRTAFVVGTAALHRHVSDAGLRVLNGTDLASRAEVVVVAGTEDFVYDDLRNAALAVRRGADFLATGRDPTYPQPGRHVARHRRDPGRHGGGSERKAEIVGKPAAAAACSRRSTGSGEGTDAGGGRPGGHRPRRRGGRGAGRRAGAHRRDGAAGT